MHKDVSLSAWIYILRTEFQPPHVDSQFHDENKLVRGLEDLVQSHYPGAATGVVHGGHLVQNFSPRVHAQTRLAAELGGEVVARAELQTLVDAGPLAAGGHKRKNG